MHLNLLKMQVVTNDLLLTLTSIMGMNLILLFICLVSQNILKFFLLPLANQLPTLKHVELFIQIFSQTKFNMLYSNLAANNARSIMYKIMHFEVGKERHNIVCLNILKE